MARKRVAGRFVKGSSDEPEGEAPATRKGVRGIKYCQSFTRKEFAAALPEVVSVLVEKAQQGSVSHLRMLLLMTGLDKEVVPQKGKPRGKSLEAILMERWERDKAEAMEDEAKPGPVCPVPHEFDF